MGEMVTLLIYIISTIIIGTSIMASREFQGELNQFELTVSDIEILLILILTIAGFYIAYLYYKRTKNKKKYLTKSKWIVNTNRFNYFFLIALVAQIIFVINTKVGVVGLGATSSFSFIFSLLGLGALFNFYYFLCRKKKSKIYIINIILFSSLQLLQGWSGFIFNIAMFEIYLYFKNRKKTSFLNELKVLAIAIFGIFIGGKLYQYAFAFKFKQRFGVVYKLTYLQGLVNLVNRLTHISISIGAYQNVNVVKELYLSSNTLFPEIRGILRPIIPRFLMPYKEFRTLNNFVIQSFNPDIVYYTSSNFGLINYSLTLLYIGFFDFSFWLVVTIILFSLSRRLINSFEQYEGQLDFLYFLLIMNLFTIGSPEMVFSYGYLQLIYVIPLLFFLKVIQFEKRRFNEN